MKNTTKKSASIVIVLSMVLTILVNVSLPASAATYDYNWGKREVDCTELSDDAEAFYTGIYVFSDMSLTQGGTSASSAPSSALYKELKTLMTNKHKTQTSYGDTKSMFKYTDCQNGGGKISSFYSGTLIGPSWDGAATWNREHTWPNSKGLGGNDENDIMMLRPTSVSENSSRGNTAYGKSSGYYNPNSESDGDYDLRGDVARICLYVYVRWGNTGRMWGSNGVMESVTVLLEWMEADPVDTWEMGRNDSVQSITGTRNVFVDYPEYAWLLFGEDVPDDMVTPSGMASGGNIPDQNPDSGDNNDSTNNNNNNNDNNNNDNNNNGNNDNTSGSGTAPDTNSGSGNGNNQQQTPPSQTGCSHTNVAEGYQLPANCGYDGFYSSSFCIDCGEEMSSSGLIPATGEHTMEKVGSGKNACEKCTVCGYTVATPEAGGFFGWLTSFFDMISSFFSGLFS